MRLMVTGGTGFVGKNLIPALNAKNIEALHFSSRDVDLTNNGLEPVIKSYSPDMIVHLASRVGGITDNANNQKEFLEENLLINTHVIKTVDEFKIPCISLSSSCCYPVHYEHSYPLKEDDFYIGDFEDTNFTYALAKACMMKQIKLSTNRHICLIPCNLVGPHDHFDSKSAHFVPSMINKLLLAQKEGKEKITLLGDGTALRQFCYVGDVCRLIFNLSLSTDSWDNLGRFVNVGPQRNLSIAEAARIIRDRFAPGVDIEFDGDTRYNGVHRKDISDERLQNHYQTFYGEPSSFDYTPFEEIIDELYEDFSLKQYN